MTERRKNFYKGHPTKVGVSIIIDRQDISKSIAINKYIPINVAIRVAIKEYISRNQ